MQRPEQPPTRFGPLRTPPPEAGLTSEGGQNVTTVTAAGLVALVLGIADVDESCGRCKTTARLSEHATQDRHLWSEPRRHGPGFPGQRTGSHQRS